MKTLLLSARFVVAAVLFVCTARAADSTSSIDLAGSWRFALDPQDRGEAEQWFQRDLEQSIRLPGSLQEQGLGLDVAVDTPWTGGIQDRSWYTAPKYAKYREPGNIKVPFWLQPDKHFLGAAWYQRTVSIPEPWSGKRVLLSLERPHWETTVWLDSTCLGSQNALSVPHTYVLPASLSPGEHRLTIRVDNRVKIGVGINAHSVSDHTQSNWNGIVGELALRATDRIWIDDVQVFPRLATKSVEVRITVGNSTGNRAGGTLAVQAAPVNGAADQRLKPLEQKLELDAEPARQITLDYVLGDTARPWDEFQPALYRLDVALQTGDAPRQHRDTASVSFGLREISTRGTEFLLNERPISLRGTLECCIFPLTGYPPTDVAAWKRLLQRAQAHGLNHLRFHSWCPPQAAFTAADELGVYFYVECSAWPNQGSAVGEGQPIDQWLYDEAARIIRCYGNHPSFILMSHGNEPAGPRQGGQYLGPWVLRQRAHDARRLYTSGAGWPVIPENQFHVTPQPRIHAWGEGLKDRINSRPPETVTDYRDFIRKYNVPVVSHEIGQWCVYPNLDEIPKYHGVLKARNFEVFRDLLEQNHMGDQARGFLMASGKLQAICYKEEIESALRTPGFGGFELLDLHDFPGQGTALVGILDPFWDSKPYITPDEFRRFCSATVPLARLAQRIFTTSDELRADVEVYHYGPQDLRDAIVNWRVVSASGEPIGAGQFPPQVIAAGGLTAVGQATLPLHNVATPQKLRLVVAIADTTIENDWDLWVYPAMSAPSDPAPVIVTEQLNAEVLRQLQQGSRVCWLLPPQRVRSDVALGFSPVFWNTAWTGNQPPHTLGILCDPTHPALKSFPTEYHTNWQWWELTSRAGAMVLDGLPPEVHPIVQVIDTWFEARRLGLVLEAKVGQGRILVCSIDLVSDLEQRPVARQMKRSLLEYMQGEKFAPQIEVQPDALLALSRTPSKMEELGVTAHADSEQSGFAASQVLDMNPETIWHTAWDGTPRPYPHEIVLEIPKPTTVLGIAYLPRQDMTNGRIAKYSVEVSDDGRQWTAAAASGEWPNAKDRQVVRFDRPRSARFVKLVAHSEVLGRAWSSAAEIELLLP